MTSFLLIIRASVKKLNDYIDEQLRMRNVWKSNKPVSLLLSLKTDIVIIRLIPELWETYDLMIKCTSQMKAVIDILPLASQKIKKCNKNSKF